MKKKLTALCLVAGLIALMVAGSTLAFFKDTDDAVNVFTMGNVDILLHEDNGLATDDPNYKLDDAYEAWVEDQDFLPTVTLEKDAWIENIGSEDAYVRMFILYPADIEPLVDIKYDADLDANWTDAGVDFTYDFGGVDYTGRCLIYNKVLTPADKITTDTITSVTLKTEVECETLANGDIKYTLGTDSYTSATMDFPVIVLAEAGQVTNELDSADAQYWDNAVDAMNVMFGKPDNDTFVGEYILVQP